MRVRYLAHVVNKERCEALREKATASGVASGSSHARDLVSIAVPVIVTGPEARKMA